MGVFFFESNMVETVKDVVTLMYKGTTKGELQTTLPSDEGYVRFRGNMICKMNFTDEPDSIIASIEETITELNALAGNEDIYMYMDNKIAKMCGSEKNTDNFFKAFLMARAARVKKCIELDAPRLILDHEVKAFAFFWVLFFYCETL